MALQRPDSGTLSDRDGSDDSGLDDSGLDDDDGEGGMRGGIPGEETEETKASHKMAERRRRQRMSGLFDTLKDMLPMNGPHPKTSKGWVLVKGEFFHLIFFLFLSFSFSLPLHFFFPFPFFFFFFLQPLSTL